jgi:hypothetical protein
MLDEGVVAEAQEIGLCLITAPGRPFRAGPRHLSGRLEILAIVRGGSRACRHIHDRERCLGRR